MGWKKCTVARARKEGRNKGYSLLPELKNPNKNDHMLGRWWALRPTTWLQEAVLSDERQDVTYEDLRELDLHYLSALNSVLTPVGWKAIVTASGDLIVTKVKGKIA